jgi:UDP-glucose 4-epimerase
MNIGSTDNVDILTLAETVRDDIDADLGIEFAERHASDADHTHDDISRANEAIGYEPTRTIREGVREFIAWYRENEDWYDTLVRQS